MSIKTAIRLFADDAGMQVIGKPQKWLIDLYLSNENENIRRTSDGFYSTKEWKEIRKRVIAEYGTFCMKCGFNDPSAHVDHIKPRSKFKELQLAYDNLQVLCGLCNLAKSNRNSINYKTSCRVNGVTTISGTI